LRTNVLSDQLLEDTTSLKLGSLTSFSHPCHQKCHRNIPILIPN
jgi:hypothetical protein